MEVAKLEQIFYLCDRNGSGFIEEEDLDDLCASMGLDPDSIKEIFKPLDPRDSGVISKHQFINGFANIQHIFCPGEDLLGDGEHGQKTPPFSEG